MPGIGVRFLEQTVIKGRGEPSAICELIWDGLNATDVLRAATRIALVPRARALERIGAGQSIRIGLPASGWIGLGSPPHASHPNTLQSRQIDADPD